MVTEVKLDKIAINWNEEQKRNEITSQMQIAWEKFKE
jgi:hypothetical protein